MQKVVFKICMKFCSYRFDMAVKMNCGQCLSESLIRSLDCPLLGRICTQFKSDSAVLSSLADHRKASTKVCLLVLSLNLSRNVQQGRGGNRYVPMLTQ